MSQRNQVIPRSNHLSHLRRFATKHLGHGPECAQEGLGPFAGSLRVSLR
jgi:hypothetical protein